MADEGTRALARDRWGDDWLVAFASLVGSERAANAPAPGCRLGEALDLLNVPVPLTPAKRARGRRRAQVARAARAAEAFDGAVADGPLAGLVARAQPFLSLVDALARRAQGRAIGGAGAAFTVGRESWPGMVTLTPVLREEDTGAGTASFSLADDPVRLVLDPADAPAAAPARWRRADDLAARPQTLAGYLCAFDADDCFLALDLGFAAVRAEAPAPCDATGSEASEPVAETAGALPGLHEAPACRDLTRAPEVPAPGMDELLAGESWLVPVAGTAVAAGVLPRHVATPPAFERAVQIRAYGTLPPDDAQLALADAACTAAAAGRGLGLYHQVARRAAAWPCQPVAGGAPRAEAVVWPQRLFPRTSSNRWPLLVLGPDGMPCVADIAAPELAGCIAEALAPARERQAPSPRADAPFFDCWDIPDVAASDTANDVAQDAARDIAALADAACAPHVVALPTGVRLRASEVRRAGGGPGNVFNKLAVLAEHGWHEEELEPDAEGHAVAVWVAPAPLVVVGFREFWRFVLRFGANLIIEEPEVLRERHRAGARERLMRFAARAQPLPGRTPEQAR